MNASENPGDYDEDLVTSSLGKVAKGAGVLFFAMIMGIFFNFVARVIIARFYTPDDYGLFNLFFTVLSIFAGVGMLGLGNGIQRFIGYYSGSREKNKIKAVERWGLLIGIISGISFGIFLFIIAPWIAPMISKTNVFVDYLRIAAVSIPFYVILNILISVFRGHQRIKERILFYDLGTNIIFLVFSFIIGILSLPFIGIIWSMFAASAVMSISFFIYYIGKKESLSINAGSYLFTLPMAKKILIFSLPLLLVDILQEVLGWTDTLMIGYYLTESAVGYYNVAKPLSIFISTGLTVSSFIYSPLVASLYSQRKFNENKEIFSILTKWICFLTLPIAMIFFFYPKEVIYFSFGADYLPAAITLQILTITFFINNFMGPNGSTLTAYGKTKYLMYSTTIAAGLNIILNILLIPIYGIIGAAIATGISIILVNIIRSYKLYSISGVHSLKPDNYKPVISTILLGSIIAISVGIIPIPGIMQVILTYCLLLIVLLLMIFITHSISNQDIQLIIMVEKKIGFNLSFLKRMLKKFM